MSVMYTAKVTAEGGRTGIAKSDDGNLEVTLTTPKSMGGDGAPGTNPEQLFAAGYSACFLGALKFIAGMQKVKIPADATVTVTVDFMKREDEIGFKIAPSVAVSLPGLDRDVAGKLVEAAHKACPYSHALRTTFEPEAVLL